MPEGRAPAREGAEIIDIDGETVGKITSGGFGPSVGGPVAMGYVDTKSAEIGTKVGLLVRGKTIAAQIVKLPFVKHSFHCG